MPPRKLPCRPVGHLIISLHAILLHQLPLRNDTRRLLSISFLSLNSLFSRFPSFCTTTCYLANLKWYLPTPVYVFFVPQFPFFFLLFSCRPTGLLIMSLHATLPHLWSDICRHLFLFCFILCILFIFTAFLHILYRPISLLIISLHTTLLHSPCEVMPADFPFPFLSYFLQHRELFPCGEL